MSGLAVDYLTGILKAMALWLLVLLLVHCNANAATAAAQRKATDVGETLRKFEERTEPNKYNPKDGITIPEKVTPPSSALPKAPEFKVTIAKIKCQGNSIIDDATLQKFLADKMGELDFKTIKNLPSKISAFYLEKGHYAHAYIPKQTIKDQTLVIQIIEAKIDQIIIEKAPNSSVDPEMARKFLKQTEGEIINLNDLKERLGILNSVPGVEAGLSVEPGRHHGTSNLKLSLKDKDRFTSSSSVNNYGFDATGVYSFSEALAANNPFGLGDSFKLNASGSLGVKVASMTYGLPAGYNGSRVYAAVSLIKIKLIGDQAYLKSYGQAETFELSHVSPFSFDLGRGYLQFSVGRSHSLSTMLDSKVNDKSANRASCVLNVDLPDSYGSWNASIKPTVGFLDLKKCRSDYNFDQSTAKRNGAYQKINSTVGRQQIISDNLSLSQVVNYQASSTNLDSFEQFSLGGLSAVRAHPTATSGDEGVVYQAELACRMSDVVAVSAFFDAGHVRINKKAWDTSSNRDGVQGYGLSLNITNGGFFGNAIVAFPNHRTNYENNEGEKKNIPKLWLSMGYRF